jgi:16S rRNA G527 N7-methylase RsmG
LGVPGIPIAIFRPDLAVKLVDSNRAKAIFLEETIAELKLSNAEVLCARFEALGEAPERSCLISRAIEKMELMTPEIIRIAGNRSQALIFGNPQMESVIKSVLPPGMIIKSWLIPNSDRRWLFELIGST